jgi:phenylacetic acid degradation operon negative regulatory protein
MTAARFAIAATLIGSRRGIAVRKLIVIGQLFGVAEVPIRKALSRMVNSGEVINNGRHYTATNKLSAKRAGLDVQRHATHDQRWSGQWEMLVLNSGESSSNADLCPTLAAAKFVELGCRAWIRPSMAGPPAGTLPAWLRSSVTRFDCQTESPEALAQQLWGLSSWGATAANLLESTQNVRLATIEMQGNLALALKLRITTVRHLEREPEVPADLLPEGWPSISLRHESDQLWAEATRETARLRQALK